MSTTTRFPSPATLWRMTRPGFLALTAVGCVLGTSIAAGCGSKPNFGIAAATLLLACLAHAAGNVLNDYHDALSGADQDNEGRISPYTGGARLIQDGIVTTAQTHQLFRGLAVVLIIAGVLLAAASTWWIIPLGIGGLVLMWAYSAPPLALMTRGLGEPVIALVWTLVVIGSDTAQRGAYDFIAVVTAVSFGLLAANILLINGFPDATADARAGKRTLVVSLGPRRAALLYLAIGTAAHLWLLAGALLHGQPMPALWGLVSWPLSLAAARMLWRHAEHPRQLRTAIVLTIQAALLHGLAMSAGFLSL